jgi:hypothetical protein
MLGIPRRVWVVSVAVLASDLSIAAMGNQINAVALGLPFFGVDRCLLRVMSRLDRSVLGDFPARSVCTLRRNMYIVFS